MRLSANTFHVSPEWQPPVSQQVSPRILLIEDDDRQRVLLSHLFAEQGYAVDSAGCAASAIAGLSASFDLMVTDIDLGSRLTGLDLVRLARAMRPDMPIIVLSARAPVELGGAVVHLRKPCPSGAILAAVQGLMPIG